ncbi:hypothetical protein AB205_0033360 [Aquarana catesbeiana]|uniref:Pyrin domain-containing protein n=1 Tax=Aquarana catesbeiana TaxID=8400 RepID=A0A2G9RYW3_AQUCT|nr:hypothetical protein AB205_0033360 [Aquarana catesbeiana]
MEEKEDNDNWLLCAWEEVDDAGFVKYKQSEWRTDGQIYQGDPKPEVTPDLEESGEEEIKLHGSAPGVLGKVPQTPGDLIIYSLEDLKGCDFKRFRNKLSDFSYGDKLPIPRGKLENADWITTKDLLIDIYGEEGALDVTNKVFTLIGLMGPANYLHERREQNGKKKAPQHCGGMNTSAECQHSVTITQSHHSACRAE